MKNNIKDLKSPEATSVFSKSNAMQLVACLPTLSEDSAFQDLTAILHNLEELLFDTACHNFEIDSINIFLRIISKKLQQESHNANAWRYFLYGRFDAQQEHLFQKLLDKSKNSQRENILARKNVTSILQFLYANGASRPSLISKNLNIDRSNLSRIMDLLVAEELVEKTKSEHSNIVIYELTSEGYQICTKYYRDVAVMNPSRNNAITSVLRNSYKDNFSQRQISIETSIDSVNTKFLSCQLQSWAEDSVDTDKFQQYAKHTLDNDLLIGNDSQITAGKSKILQLDF